jgi:hypothetical protein
MAIREQVSGPGSNSKRTDLNVSKQPQRYMSGGTYGEGQELLGLQQGADMSAGPNMVGGVGMSKPITRKQPIEMLTAPTSRPNEPLSQGVDFGPGDGSEILNLPPKTQRTTTEILQQLLATDESGFIASIINNGR